MRDLVIDSFAGGGASEGASVCSRHEVGCLLPRNKHHGDLILPTPYYAAADIIFHTAHANDNIIKRTGCRIDDYDSTRISIVSHLARHRLKLAFNPNGAVFEISSRSRVRHLKFQFGGAELPIYLRLTWRLFELYRSKHCIVEREGSPLYDLGHASRRWRGAIDLPLFAAE